MALTFFAASVSTEAGSGEPGENENLPFFGRFYGNGVIGPYRGVGNSNHNRDISSFFWADRTAVVAGFQWHLRWGNNGYSAGDGGEYTVRVVEADPDTKLPVTPLVTVSQLTGYRPAQEHGFNASDAGNQMHVEKEFTTKGQIVAKKGYCIEWVNTHSDRSNNYVATNNDRQVSYFNDGGPNSHAPEPGFWNPARINIDGQDRPWFPWPVTARSGTLRWRRMGPPLVTIRYADGIHSGWGSFAGGGDLFTVTLSGNNQQRDRFRVTRASRVVDRLYIWPWRQNTTGGNLVVTLEQGPSADLSGNGTVIEELSVPVSSLYNAGSSWNVDESSPDADDQDKVPWIEMPFSQPRTLQLGTIYSLRLRSTGGAVQIRVRYGQEQQGLSPIASSWAEHEQIRKVSWLAGEDSRGAQFTSDGGSSWTWHGGRKKFGWLMRCVV